MAAGLIKNISWLGFGSAAVKPIWFVFITYVCYETIGTAQYGVMTASLSLMAILIGTSSLGTSQYTIREVARDRDRAPEFLTNLFPIRMLLGLTCLGGGLLYQYLMSGDEAGFSSAYLFAGIYVLTLNLTEYCRSFYRAHEIMRDEALSIVLEKLLVVGLGTVMLLRWPSAAGALAGLAAGTTLTLLLNLYWVNRRFASFSRSLFNRPFIKEGLKQALPLGMVSIFVLIYFRTDSVMLEAIQGEVPTGQYGVAFRVLEALLLFPGIIVAVLLPRLSTLFSDVIDPEFDRLLRKSVWILAGFGVLVATVLMFAAPWLVGILEEGSAAEPATKALKILVWTFPFASVNYIFSTALTASNDQNALAWMLGAAVVFNIVLNLVLIPSYSLYGASYATLATQVMVLAALTTRYFMLRRRTR